MASKRKKQPIRPIEVRARTRNIPHQELVDLQETILFSFKHWDSSDKRFCATKCDRKYMSQFAKRMNEISSMTVADFSNLSATGDEVFHIHKIDWKKTDAPHGFKRLREELREMDAFQFAVSNQHGRVHGFFINNVFFIVWLDPDHQLYKGKH